MKQIEWTCPKCSYRTSLPVALCPVCEVRLMLRERTWAPSPIASSPAERNVPIACMSFRGAPPAKPGPTGRPPAVEEPVWRRARVHM